METTKTHKKKRPLKNRINIDKLSERIAESTNNFNLEIEDIKKILNQHSIPGFENETKDMSEIIQTLKTKSIKKKRLLKIPPKEPINQDVLNDFFESINNEIDKKNNESQPQIPPKTLKKVKFSTVSPVIEKKKDTRITLDSLIENVNKKPEVKPQLTQKIIYNPDPRIDIRDHVSRQLNKNESDIIPVVKNNNLEEEKDKVRVVKISNKFLESDDNDNDNDNDNHDNRKIIKPIPRVLKPKSKEEIYQETLSQTINLIENKIQEYEHYSLSLDENHPILLQLRIDIINQKKKLKELLPNAKINDPLIDKKDHKDHKEITQNKVNTLKLERYNKYEKDEKDEKGEKKNDHHPIFKYDPKIVEKEYQQMLKKHSQTQTHKTPIVKSIKKPISNVNLESNKKLPQNIKQPKNDLRSLNILNRIPRFAETKKESKPEDNIKIVCYVSDDEEFPMPQKKVKVKESENKTCSIFVVEKTVNIKAEPISTASEIKEVLSNQSQIIHVPVPIKPIIKIKKNKTMINSNKFENKPFRRDHNDLYSHDKEKHPSHWRSVPCNDKVEIITHVKPVKLTQKKITDFLVKEKITNENKKLPTELMNFLYSSITENDYQVNFIDVLN